MKGERMGKGQTQLKCPLLLCFFMLCFFFCCATWDDPVLCHQINQGSVWEKKTKKILCPGLCLTPFDTSRAHRRHIEGCWSRWGWQSGERRRGKKRRARERRGGRRGESASLMWNVQTIQNVRAGARPLWRALKHASLGMMLVWKQSADQFMSVCIIWLLIGHRCAWYLLIFPAWQLFSWCFMLFTTHMSLFHPSSL